jgi:signal transduction histidine kinase
VGPAPRLEVEDLLFLHRATGELFAHPGDYGATLEALVRLAVPELADWCAVDLLCDDGTLARAALRHRDPGRAGAVDELRQLPPSVGPLDPERVAAIGDPDLVASVAGSPELVAACQLPGRPAELLRRLGLESFVTVPLAARGRTLGALTLACADSGRRYDPARLAFAGELGSRCALALDNARLFRDGEEARRLAERSARFQEDAVRFGEQLLGIVSHDLRNPLASVRLGLETMRRRGLPTEHLRTLERMERSTERMQAIIAGLLDVTRIRQGQGLPLVPEPVALDAVVTRVLDGMPEDQVQRVQRVSAAHPAGFWDPERLAQAVGNLIGNALQHGEPGRPVTLRIAEEQGRAELSVHNHGPPIPPALQPSIFEPFQRGLHPGVLDGSIGLGLYIVRQVALSHGGEVRVRSVEGEGTTFTIELPLGGAPGSGRG